MNTINIIDYNPNNYHPYINRKIAKLQQQERSFDVTPCFSYQSKGNPVNLNSKVTGFINEPNYNVEFTLKNGKRSSPQIIACRHLAERYINTDQAKSVYLSSIDTKEKLENHPDFLIDHNRLAKPKNSELAYYFSLDQLPQVIKKLVINECLAKNKQDICFLLHSSAHAMAIRIKQKIEEEVFIIYFYDPNKTNIHKKIVLSDINQINKITLEVLFGNTISSYFTEDTPTACLLELSTKTTANKTKDIKIFGTISPTMLYLIALNEHVNDKILQDLLSKQDDKKIFNFNMLNAQNNGLSVLSIALILNKVETLTTLFNAIMNSKLDYPDKIILLVALDANGNTGLYNAFCTNSTEAITEFCQSILNSDLKYKDKILLLNGYNNKKLPSIVVAHVHNLTASLVAFTRVIEQSNLKQEDKNMLLYNHLQEFQAMYPGWV